MQGRGSGEGGGHACWREASADQWSAKRRGVSERCTPTHTLSVVVIYAVLALQVCNASDEVPGGCEVEAWCSCGLIEGRCHDRVVL